MTDETIDWRNLPPVPEHERPQIRENWVPSQSFLRMHDNCDRAAMLHLRHRGGPTSHPLNRGGLFHEVIDRLEHLVAESQADAEDLVGADYVPDAEERGGQAMRQVPPDLGKAVVAEVMAEHPEMQIPAAERDALRYMVDHWCRGTYFSVPILGIETTFTLEVEMPDGFKVRVLARADLVEDLGGGMCQITDYKTAWPPSSEDFTRQAYDREGKPRWAGNYQLNMLAVLAHFGVASDGFRLGNFDRYRLVLAFPRELKPEGIVRRVIDVDPVQLTSYREDLELQLRRLFEVNVAEGRWQATPGHHCRECPAEYECPLPPLLRPESQHAELDDMASLEKAAAASVFLSQRGSTLKSRVKKAAERLEENDPAALLLPNGDRGVMAGKGIAFIFVPTEREEIRDKDQFRQAIDDAAGGGPEPNWAELYKRSEGVAFEKRRVGS